MQNFFNVLTVEQIVSLLEAYPPLPAESCALDEADGRVLAHAVSAEENLPLTDRSGMDGYALRAADTFGVTENNPTYLRCIANIDIRTPPNFEIRTGECAAVVTGGVMPAGADAVMMVEYTHDMGADMVEIHRPVAPGEHVMFKGEDAQAGKVLLPAGTLLRPQEVGLLAAMGKLELPVYKRPRVAIISTGDELIPVHRAPEVGQVRDVNSHTLACLVRRAGGEAIMRGLVPDKLEALCSALHEGLQQADVVLLSGGSSVGVRDLTVAALKELGGTRILCRGAALSPGKPLILADIRGKTVWGLPGQVTSAQVVMMVLGQAFLRRLHGEDNSFDQTLWPRQRARLTRNIASRQGREDYVRVRLERTDDGMIAAVPTLGMSGLLHSLIESHGLVRIPTSLEGLEAGREVDVLLF